MSPKDIALGAAKAALDKKGEDVQVLDMRQVMVDTDFFVIVSAPTMAQIRAITEEIKVQLADLGFDPAGSHGRADNTWVLLDYGSVVVHVFMQEERIFYSLEKLWADAKKVPVEE